MKRDILLAAMTSVSPKSGCATETMTVVMTPTN